HLPGEDLGDRRLPDAVTKGRRTSGVCERLCGGGPADVVGGEMEREGTGGQDVEWRDRDTSFCDACKGRGLGPHERQRGGGDVSLGDDVRRRCGVLWRRSFPPCVSGRFHPDTVQTSTRFGELLGERSDGMQEVDVARWEDAEVQAYDPALFS